MESLARRNLAAYDAAYLDLASRAKPINVSREMTLPGQEVYFDTLVIKFDDHFIEQGDPLWSWRSNIAAIYNMLEERRDTSDVTDLLKELHRIVNEAIRAAEPGDAQAEVKFCDLSQIDLERLRDEFAKKVRRKASTLQDIRQVVEDKLAQMVAPEPTSHGLLQEVGGDRRRLQSRERPSHHRGDIRKAGGPRQ